MMLRSLLLASGSRCQAEHARLVLPRLIMTVLSVVHEVPVARDPARKPKEARVLSISSQGSSPALRCCYRG